MTFEMQLVKARKSKYKKAKDFVDKINESIKAEGFTKGTIAYNTYNAYEKGRREPRYELLVRIARLLDTSIDTLLELNTKDEATETNLAIVDQLLENEFPADDLEKAIFISCPNGRLFALDRTACHAIFVKAEAERQKVINEGFKALLATERPKQATDFNQSTEKIIAQAAALEMGLDYSAFAAHFDPGTVYPGRTRIFYRTKKIPVHRGTPLLGLCFYYLTGINPLTSPEEASVVVHLYAQYPMEELSITAQKYRAYQKSLSRIFQQYQPAKRMWILEAYVAQMYEIDYTKFLAKIDEKQQLGYLKTFFFAFLIDEFLDIGLFNKANDAYRALIYQISTPIRQKYIDAMQSHLQDFSEIMSVVDGEDN